MGISKKEVEHIAKLARLEFTGDEFEHLTGQLSAILNYVSKLNELNTENVEPTSHVIDLKNCFKEDMVKESLPGETALKNAPEQEIGFYKVPKIIE